ncbi:aldehyde dehydrogenase (NADP(+)) [Flectobacillus sp. BAB-3569]|uniref:aldehyde dehydrogenase (NADP(+)) n=1 Tax=Flectobacillus sp. BAB-3569 TaxID=1509483 RepID=UPI000BA2DC73|nr:aldehyde dehydrogenase (NADP(+)) [Flectobacillus sp. BAB-3569]PAC32504.1 aldehyde dehydrogenase (NADP(+)) [Flectobacillus sp. BAB-3569]
MENLQQHIDSIMQKAAEAFKIYRKVSGKEKALFLRTIAQNILDLGDSLIQIAHQETNIPEVRLIGERTRTCFQLETNARLLEEGSWVEARIDTALPNRQPMPRPDIRKMLIPIGPVVVFGASNFPFAYSTAGGDTASALAAGCPVVVKGHPAHAKTSEMVAEAVLKAVSACGLPDGTFAHVAGHSFEVGRALVLHPVTKAVGFTGSLNGGKALFDLANQRPEPIPVFSEMGSINPVVLMPQKLNAEASQVALTYANSITLGMGQFCTNPGLILAIDNPDLDTFIETLSQAVEQVAPAAMLNAGIYQNFEGKRTVALSQEGVKTEVESLIEKTGIIQAIPTIASVSSSIFLENPTLHQEVFGPYSLIVKCTDLDNLLQVIEHLEGQLTATLIATEEELQENPAIFETLRNICGRLIFNGVPTGVEVCYAMQHGGPFPATTDARFGAVGPDAIKRWVRPASFQNFPENLLPAELQSQNPLNIWRIVNDEWTK